VVAPFCAHDTGSARPAVSGSITRAWPIKHRFTLSSAAAVSRHL